MQINTNINGIKNIAVSQDVSANNIANMNTDGFKASRVIQSTDKVNISPEARLAAQNAMGIDMSTTQASQDINQMSINQSSLQANISAIQTQDMMFQALLDIKK